MTPLTRPGLNLGIHGARGLFCLAVVVYHVWNSGLPRVPVPEVLALAMQTLRYGVEAFFAISGFVIFVTMRANPAPLAFLANRATRIFPVLWACVLVFLPLGILDGNPEVTGSLERPLGFALDLAGNLLALGPVWPVPVFYGVTWTISYELTFYALCGLYLATRGVGGRDWGWLFLLAGVALIAWQPRALFFVSGMLVAQGWLADRSLAPLVRWPLVWLAVFAGAWHGLAAPVPPFFRPVLQWDWTDALLAAVAFGAMTLAIAAIARGRGLLVRLLVTPVWLWLGTISYSLYLWHPMVLGVVKEAMQRAGLVDWSGGLSQLLFLVLALPTSLLVAHLSQRWLEVRLTGWLRRRRGPVSPAAAGPPEASAPEARNVPNAG